MRLKYIVLIALSVCLLSGMAFADCTVVIASKTGGGAACDDCSGNLLYSHHCENNDDATAGTPPLCGCSDSATYKSWIKTTAAYSDVQKNDGTYSILCNSADGCKASIDNTGNWLGIEITGCWKGYVYLTSDVNQILAYLGSTITVEFVAATDVIKLTYGGEYLASVVTISQNTWTYVECAWDASQSAGSDKLKVVVGATTAENTTKSLTNQAALTPSHIIGSSSGAKYFYMDQVQLWSSYAGN